MHGNLQLHTAKLVINAILITFSYQTMFILLLIPHYYYAIINLLKNSNAEKNNTSKIIASFTRIAHRINFFLRTNEK